MTTKALRGRLLRFVGDPAELGAAARRYDEDGAILMRSGRIVAAGDARVVLDGFSGEIVDHRPHLLMPGFVDAHLHAVMGGLALQLDRSIGPGDWVKLGGTTGRVREITWRQTTLETRGGETVLVPNSLLAKSEVHILGLTDEGHRQVRRSVLFYVGDQIQPQEVIEAVTEAFTRQPIANLSGSPAPDVLLVAFESSWVSYAVRYWLTDFTADEKTLGKPVGGDLREGIVTLPVLIYAEQTPDAPALRRLWEYRADGVNRLAAADEVVAAVRDSAAIEAARAEARAMAARAEAALAALPAAPARDILADLAATAVSRQD